MPLTFAGEVDVEQPASESRQRARKVKPQYTRGELRQVATARQQPEAELIQLLLLEEGIPSTIKRTVWDVPEMLPAGPRAVLVPASGYEQALAVLSTSDLDLAIEHERARQSAPSPIALLAGILGAAGLLALAIFLFGNPS